MKMKLQRELKARSGDYQATVTLRAYRPEVDAGIWQGAESTPPTQVVHRLQIHYKGRTIPVLRSVYADLSEVNRVSFQKRGTRMVLEIEGGDAAGSYRAFITLEKGKIVSRRVEDGEFPKNFFEETRYVSIPVRD